MIQTRYACQLCQPRRDIIGNNDDVICIFQHSPSARSPSEEGEAFDSDDDGVRAERYGVN